MTYNDILRVMYDQYFCAVCEFTEEQLLEAHKAFGDALEKNENIDYSDLLVLDDLQIWEPFEKIKPIHIFHNIEQGIYSLEFLKND